MQFCTDDNDLLSHYCRNSNSGYGNLHHSYHEVTKLTSNDASDDIVINQKSASSIAVCFRRLRQISSTTYRLITQDIARLFYNRPCRRIRSGWSMV